MFGRVPRLPVDILFGNVLTDPDVTSFDRYVSKLSEDLREAMLIAQEHATKEQGRQTRLYNRKVKGATIEIGDRVLVANKKERGKRKVADRWEPTVYTVMDKNAKTHTYKIQNTVTGSERVVHRNLLMLVNFLPVQGVPHSSPSDLSMSSVLSSVPDVHSMASGQTSSKQTEDQVSVQQESQHSVEDVQSLMSDSVPVNDLNGCLPSSNIESPSSDVLPVLPVAKERTREWVSHLNTPGHLPDSLEGTFSEPLADPTDVLSDEASDLCSGPSYPTHTDETVVKDALTVSDHNTACLVTSDTAPTDVHTELSEPVPQTTTRLGRVIRPVNRLLYTIARQDITKRLQQNVQTVCSSVVQALRA
ncbi:uncharacterized protein LOC125301405 [Alosa alosa]|uniref:uncharacterized protein LOC125301405 n=1 Tax=Alosa alosa TaxID=278164 RepID=UPI002015180B|nr:uncharacterized protein LOC125301405 [Alosa alosa]